MNGVPIGILRIVHGGGFFLDECVLDIAQVDFTQFLGGGFDLSDDGFRLRFYDLDHFIPDVARRGVFFRESNRHNGKRHSQEQRQRLHPTVFHVPSSLWVPINCQKYSSARHGETQAPCLALSEWI